MKTVMMLDDTLVYLRYGKRPSLGVEIPGFYSEPKEAGWVWNEFTKKYRYVKEVLPQRVTLVRLSPGKYEVSCSDAQYNQVVSFLFYHFVKD